MGETHKKGTATMQEIEQILFSWREIAAKAAELGAAITADYEGKSPLLVGVLTGCVFFMSDLSRTIALPLEMAFMQVSSYGDAAETSGAVRILTDLPCDIAGRDVIVVEDIVDSGLTLAYLLEQLQSRKPASLKVCALLDKPSRRKIDIDIDYLGFTAPDAFLVGYGLDYAGRWRNLPYIGELKKEVYSSGCK